MTEQSRELRGSVDDARELGNLIEGMTASTKEFERVFASTISQAITQGSSFEDTLRSIGLKLAKLALQSALAPVEKSLSSFVGSAFGNSSGSGIGSPTSITPTLLTSQMSSGQKIPSVSNVTFNIQTNDATSFKKSETQISSMLARAVGRGQRGL